MRIPNADHAAHPWVISRIAPDFRLLDVWALPVEGRPEEFEAFLEQMPTIDPSRDGGSIATRVLFAVRLRLGAWLGWDDAARQRPIPGCTETTLRDRLPVALRDSGSTIPIIGGTMARIAGGFQPLYRADNEWAAEISNGTVHGVMQIAWVEQLDGRWRAQMAVYVKTRGRLGDIYMRFIDPFRHLIVYPALMRQIGRVWAAQA